jgi:protoporphyrin/coproporphyrin ferrochelatase
MKTGVLLINLGTPDSPSTRDVRKYLTQFLNDKRVIDINPVSRFLLVNGIIIPFRAPKSAKLYKQIWTKEGSPLLIHGKALREKVQEYMGNDFVVELAMRYQSPSIESVMKKMAEENLSRIIVLPLYPQFATSSTESTIAEVRRAAKKLPKLAPLHFIPHFFQEPGYINSFVELALKHDPLSFDHVVFSYHGLPKRQITKASQAYGMACVMGKCCNKITSKNTCCYRAGCFETTRKIAEALKLPEDKYTTAFQSRLDEHWLQPFSDQVIAELPRKGAKRILVLSPAFVADCLETIYEIGVEYKEIFKENGGQELAWVESLNANSSWVNTVKEMILKKIA